MPSDPDPDGGAQAPLLSVAASALLAPAVVIIAVQSVRETLTPYAGPHLGDEIGGRVRRPL